MKIEINDSALVDEIAKRVVEQLKPLIKNSHDSKGDELMGVREFAKYLGVEKEWVYSHIKEIPHYKVGKFPKFRKKETDKWLELQKAPQNIVSVKRVFSI